MRTDRFQLSPEWVVAASSALWGLYWIPLRAIEERGLDANWTTLIQFLVPAILLLPVAILRALRGRSFGMSQIASGLLIGMAFALYCQSLLLTDVVRALILFYVMPSWGTLLEVTVLRRRFTRWRALALLLGMVGLLTIVSGDIDTRLHLNAGDWMALVSGVVFAFGALKVRTEQNSTLFEQLFSFFVFGTVSAVALILISPVPISSTFPSRELGELMPWMLLMAVVFLIPVMGGIYWGSGQVDPGRLGILLQLEAVVGIVSAALLANEVFGIREALGAVLVISAGLAEVLGSRHNGLPTTQPAEPGDHPGA